MSRLPAAHILQSWDWGQFKHAAAGWRPIRLAFERDGRVVAMASLGLRRLGPFSMMVVSKGPALDYSDATLFDSVIDALENRAKAAGAVWLKIDPDVIAATGLPDADDDQPNATGRQIIARLNERGWRFSADQVQFRNTIAIDLRRSEDELLMTMSGNTRRKIRAAMKKDVTIRPANIEDIPLLYDLYRVTAERDGFLIRPYAYYQRAWQTFMRANLAFALIAEYAGKPIAHVILYHFGRKCWYFYGASSSEERQRMPNYLLQWEAIKRAKALGCATYDMWGAPDVFDETDSMWGVYQFKRGFRGQVIRHIGAWDYAPRPWLYRAYTKAVPSLMKFLRR